MGIKSAWRAVVVALCNLSFAAIAAPTQPSLPPVRRPPPLPCCVIIVVPPRPAPPPGGTDGIGLDGLGGSDGLDVGMDGSGDGGYADGGGGGGGGTGSPGGGTGSLGGGTDSSGGGTGLGGTGAGGTGIGGTGLGGGPGIGGPGVGGPGMGGGGTGATPADTGKQCTACMYGGNKRDPTPPCPGGAGACKGPPPNGGGPVPMAAGCAGANCQGSSAMAGKTPDNVTDCLAGQGLSALVDQLCGATPSCKEFKDLKDLVQESPSCCPACFKMPGDTSPSPPPDPAACAKALCATPAAAVLGPACSIGGLVGGVASCIAAPLTTFLCDLQNLTPNGGPPLPPSIDCGSFRGQMGGRNACLNCCFASANQIDCAAECAAPAPM